VKKISMNIRAVVLREVANKREIFSEWDDSGRRGYDQKLFKKRFRPDVSKFAFSNRAVNDLNPLSSQCVTCYTVNTLETTIS